MLLTLILNSRYNPSPGAKTNNAGPDRGGGNHGGVLGSGVTHGTHGGGGSFGTYKVGGGVVVGGGGTIGVHQAGPMGIPTHGCMVAVVFDRRRITSCSCTCGSQVGVGGK